MHTNQTAPVVLADVLKPPVVYANHSRTGAFENPTDGTTKTRQGAIAVTTVLFTNAEEQTRLTETMNYTVSVTNVDQSGDDSSPDNVALQFGTETTSDPADGGTPPLVNATQVVPGAQYASTATLSNPGSDSGTVYFNVSYQSFENGIANEAEARVDATGGDPGRGNGELHQAVELRIARVNADGTLTYVLGNTSTYRDLTAISQQSVPLTELSADETTDLRVEYRIEPTAGNEIQSDTISLDFHFLIQS
ncbi:hypothetical protein ACOZ32_14210 (plasmid) [Halobacterium sp. MBLA0001]|uniref:hypothetical protein n=1 Tax=Halobacterium sp. MBLA0001 TaxID=3413511 RepID=UPI003C72B2D0